jgi:hypothetical protein
MSNSEAIQKQNDLDEVILWIFVSDLWMIKYYLVYMQDISMSVRTRDTKLYDGITSTVCN